MQRTFKKCIQAKLETVQNLLYHLRSERTDSEYLLKEVWESVSLNQRTSVLEELETVIDFLERREQELSSQ